MGLALLVSELFDKILLINKSGMTVLLNEQNARLAMKISNYTYVLEQGVIKMEGPSEQLYNDPGVARAYLGKHAGKI